jgi:hypothetical protein
MTDQEPWVPVAKNAAKLLPKNRSFTPLEALYSLQLDHTNGNKVSMRGLAKRWNWSHKKARCFMPRAGAKIVYPEGTSNIKNQRGHIEKANNLIEPNSPNFNEGHNQGHKEGTINFIDFNKLGDGRGTKRAQSGATTKEKEKENNTLTSLQSKKDGIPHEEILDLYHAILPELPRVRVFTKKRKSMLGARWQESKKRQKLDWWSGYFEHVRKSKFLMGEIDNFQGNFEWLINASNLVKVLEGNYHR